METAIILLRQLGEALYEEAEDVGTATEHGKLLVRLARAHNRSADQLARRAL